MTKPGRKGACGHSLQIGQGENLSIKGLVALGASLGGQDPGVDDILDSNLQSSRELLGQVICQCLAGSGGLPRFGELERGFFPTQEGVPGFKSNQVPCILDPGYRPGVKIPGAGLPVRA